MRTSLIAISLFLAGTSAASVCDHAPTREWLSAPGNLRPLSALPAAVRSARVVLIGEIHYMLPGKRKLLTETLAPSLGDRACFFYELSAKKTIAAHLKSFANRGEYDLVHAQFKEMHRVAKAMKLDEITVDAPPLPSVWDFRPMDERNAIMAANIAKHFASGRCERAIFFVGKAHLMTSQDQTSPLTTALRKRGVGFATVNLQDARESDALIKGSAIASWNGACGDAVERLPEPARPMFFRSADWPADLVFNPLKDEGARWNEFEWTVLAR